MIPFIWTRNDDGSDFVKACHYSLPEPVVAWLLGQIAAVNKPCAPTKGAFNGVAATELTATHVINFLSCLGVHSEEAVRDYDEYLRKKP